MTCFSLRLFIRFIITVYLVNFKNKPCKIGHKSDSCIYCQRKVGRERGRYDELSDESCVDAYS